MKIDQFESNLSECMKDWISIDICSLIYDMIYQSRQKSHSFSSTQIEEKVIMFFNDLKDTANIERRKSVTKDDIELLLQCSIICELTGVTAIILDMKNSLFSDDQNEIDDL